MRKVQPTSQNVGVSRKRTKKTKRTEGKRADSARGNYILKFKKKLIYRMAPTLGIGYLKLFSATSRMEWQGEENLRSLEAGDLPIIFTSWHSRLGILATQRTEKPVHVLVSRHGDGEIIARVANAFNKPAVRGSTSRGAAGGLRRLAELVEKGEDIGITPDGPRGPRFICQMGPIAVAKMTGSPILPHCASVKRKKIVNSWDRFMLPYPFNTGVVIFHPPLYVPSDADENTMEACRQALERSINSAMAEADALFA